MQPSPLGRSIRLRSVNSTCVRSCLLFGPAGWRWIRDVEVGELAERSAHGKCVHPITAIAESGAGGTGHASHSYFTITLPVFTSRSILYRVLLSAVARVMSATIFARKRMYEDNGR